MIGRNGELIPPCTFLPAAEQYGLIGDIDRWVIAQAIALAADGRSVHVNLSAQSVADRGLLASIERQLHQTGTDPGNLVFELTETALMDDINTGERFAHGLAKLGCAVALDDFGTGFGSFTHLKRLPVKVLKIDIEFVRNLTTSTSDQHLVKAMVNLALGFGQQTIAEGVEDAQTLELLREYGVDFAQGFHLGRPAPIDTPPAP
jgi:EAL domain-containing protein (putative c-di-GMP-specific phosphodiesterase class I)